MVVLQFKLVQHYFQTDENCLIIINVENPIASSIEERKPIWILHTIPTFNVVYHFFFYCFGFVLSTSLHHHLNDFHLSQIKKRSIRKKRSMFFFSSFFFCCLSVQWNKHWHGIKMTVALVNNIITLINWTAIYCMEKWKQ